MADPRGSWWVIHGEEMYQALLRVACGADPDLEWIALYANTEDGTPPSVAEIAELLNEDES